MKNSISREIYEQVKAEVLEELRATNKAKAQARQAARMKERRQIAALFEPIRVKYTPLLAKRYQHTFASGGRSLYQIIDATLTQAIKTAIRTLGLFDETDVYRAGKAEEANKLAEEILDAMLKN